MNKVEQIPKIIHYCWFGRKEKPDIVKKCIETWSSQLTDYELKEWNEDNFDIAITPYVQEAYKSGKFAFVSDYVRVYALYHIGGIYLDTDVKVYKAFDDLLHLDSFWGFEQGNYIATSTIGAQPGNPLIESFLNKYHERNFISSDGSYDVLTNVAVITEMFEKLGIKADGTYQQISGVGTVYPQSYFSPYDYINCRYLTEEHTYAMHLFYKSWLPKHVRAKAMVKKLLATLIGGENIYRIRKLVHHKK